MGSVNQDCYNHKLGMRKNDTCLRTSSKERLVLLLAVLMMTSVSGNAQWCTATTSSCTSDFINSVVTNGGCSNIINPGTGCSGTNSYTNYAATQIHATLPGSSVSFSIQLAGGTGNKVVRIWVDYNGNNVFDAADLAFTSVAVAPGTTVNGSFTVPLSAIPGLTRMRIRVNPLTAATSACGATTSGEIEDYGFLINASTACSGTPTAGTTNAVTTTVCYNNTVQLSLTGATCGTGLTYQWQYFDGTTWLNVPNTGTNISYTSFPITASTQFRAQLTCGANSATSTPITINPTTVGPPWTETFEGITAQNQLPTCMSGTNVGTNLRTWLSSPLSGNRINHTPGGSKYATFSPTGNAYMFTPGLNLVGGQMYQFKYWYITDGANGINTVQAYFGSTANSSGMTNFIGQLTTPINNTTYQQFVGYFTPLTTGVYYVGLFCNAATPAQYLTIDDIEVLPLPPCNGMPTAGTVFPTGPINLCAGSATNLTITGSTPASNLAYQWQASNNNVNFFDVTGGTGFNTPNFLTPPVYDTTYFRLKLTCTNTNDSAFSNAVIVNAAEAKYASLPFTETFEAWSSRCSNSDVPGINWANTPNTGNSSWRRNDQGATANWSTPIAGANVPQSIQGLFSARFHSTYASPVGTRGSLDLLLNCAGTPPTKELSFYYINLTGIDSLKILLSTDAGGNFTEIGSASTAGSWTYQSLNFTSTSPTTVLRFQGKSDAVTTGSDIGVDALQVLPQCAGKPNVGVIDTASPCSGATFGLNLLGGSPAAGVTYEWQSSPDGFTNWSPVPGGTLPILSTTISAPTYFRAIATCINSGLADTTPVKFIPLASFYYCYCTSNATAGSGPDIGNVRITQLPGNYPVLNNGLATPLINNPAASATYTDYRLALPPIVTYRDSLWRIAVTQISSGTFVPSVVAVWVDLDHNGVYDATEAVYELGVTSTSTPPQQVDDTFKVPDTALLGVTGMRIVLQQGTTSPVPCGTYTNGETEDYLIDIRKRPCTGPANPGLAIISDTAGCVGYTVIVSDTSHEQGQSNLEWVWEYSPDGNAWSVLPGSTNKDSIIHLVTGPTYFRLRMICFKLTASDTTYSNVVNISINLPYACYCYSLADGGWADSSDNSLFQIGTYQAVTGGPHLQNPTAVEARTDYTDVSDYELWSDSTYQISVFHSLKRAYHADAKITLFMDLNNDFQYSASERMWTTYSTPTNWYINGSVYIPAAVITNIRTGMRLVLNNNIGPNPASDDGCGAYTSGETEDYVVIFRNAASSISSIARVSGVDVYPNPSKGRFNVDVHLNASLPNVSIRIIDVIGREIDSKAIVDPAINSSHTFDLSEKPNGVYFLEISDGVEKLLRKVVIQ